MGDDRLEEASGDIYTFCIIINLPGRDRQTLCLRRALLILSVRHVTLIVTEIRTHLSSTCRHLRTVGEGCNGATVLRLTGRGEMCFFDKIGIKLKL